jgi:prefoldin subunit 5
MSDIDPIQTARELATHANDIEHLQQDMDKMIKDMQEIKAAIQSIQNTLSEAKGGWKVLMLVGGAAGVIGAGIVQVIHWFKS